MENSLWRRLKPTFSNVSQVLLSAAYAAYARLKQLKWL